MVQGRKVWTQETLSVGDLQGYLMDQSVMRFSNAAARSAALPVAQTGFGMVTWLDSTARLEVWRGTTLGWQPLRLNPVNLQALSATANWQAPNGGQITSGFVVDPTSLFGAGIGARVSVDACVLVDTQSGAATDWYLNLYNNQSAGGAVLAGQDYVNVNGRKVFRCAAQWDVAAGATSGVYTTLTAQGTSTGQIIRTYADPTSNRVNARVHPILP